MLEAELSDRELAPEWHVQGPWVHPQNSKEIEKQKKKEEEEREEKEKSMEERGGERQGGQG